MKKQVLFRFVILVGIISMVCPREVFSQVSNNKFIVKGKIVDSQGEKAVGATIVVKATDAGTVTDVNGAFSIQLPSEKAVLSIRHFSTSQVWEDSFEAGKEYVIRLAPDSVSTSIPVFDRVEELPRPTAGEEGWYTYLAKNVKYPQIDREHGVEGTVIIGFDVMEDGSIDRVAILRGIGGESDKEALRVIAEGPRWEPGKIGGEAVNTRMSLPVRFVLNRPSGEKPLASAREKAIADLYGQHLVVVGYLPTATQR
jgi:TonB family protein